MALKILFLFSIYENEGELGRVDKGGNVAECEQRLPVKF